MQQKGIATPTAPNLAVTIPNGGTITSTTATTFDIKQVPTNANIVRVFDNLWSGNLLSIGQYCDNKCSAHFYEKYFTINNQDGKEIIRGPRNWSNNLWKADVPVKQQHHQQLSNKASHAHCNTILKKKTPQQELMDFIYRTFGNPKPHTFQRGIRHSSLPNY